MKFKVKKVLPIEHQVNPLLMNVDHRTLTEEELDDCECSWYRHKTKTSNRIVKFKKKNNECYHGVINSKKTPYKNILVMQNKKSNKITLIEVTECQLSRNIEKPSKQSVYDNDKIEDTYEDNRTMLLKAFGSKKSKRVSEMGLKKKINSEIMTSQIKSSTADIMIDTKELQLADSSVDTCLPPCHREATSPEGVYLIEDFLTPHELNSLEDEAFVALNLMPFSSEDSGYSQFVLNSMERLQNKISIEKIKVLLFIDSLIRFINLPLKKLKKSDILEKVCPSSEPLAKKILDDYTIDTSNGRVRNVTMDDKIVIHIIVLIVIACEFSCNIDELSKYLPKFSTKKLGQITRALCLTTRDKITWFIKLPLPPARSVFLKRRT